MVSRTVRGSRRSPAGGHTEFSAFAPVFRASDGGTPVALSTAVRRGKKSKNGRPEMNRLQWLQEEEIKRLENMLNMPSAPELEPSRQEVCVKVQRVRKQKAE